MGITIHTAVGVNAVVYVTVDNDVLGDVVIPRGSLGPRSAAAPRGYVVQMGDIPRADEPETSIAKWGTTIALLPMRSMS